jgi:hypothetical protein
MAALLTSLVGGCNPPDEPAPAPDISFFVLVKSSNYAQDSVGQLSLMNYHFFSEIFLLPEGQVTSASLWPADDPSRVMEYVDQGSTYWVEGGHFDSVEQLDAAYPNGDFVFNITMPSVQLENVVLRLAGEDGQTDIPDPITIYLEQGGEPVSPLQIDASRDLVVKWSEYSRGRADPRGVVDDLLFVVIADCHGERIFHTGLPFQGDFLTYRATEVVAEAGTLDTGQPYSAFVEFPVVADSKIVEGIPGFTSFANSTYLDLHTTGPASDPTCPAVRPPMDTGQTDRSERVPPPGG